MSGHSKWATIKHKKAAQDAKRGKIFTRLIKEITVAAREGGGDPEANPRLRQAIARAKDNNMPADNIERAIKKGTGELPGVQYESVVYEGYGPGGVAVLVEVYTDNKNRAVAEVRHIFSKKGGNLAGAGSVAWMFSRKGLIRVGKDKADENTILDIALEAGAEDVKTLSDQYEIQCPPELAEDIKQAITEKGIEVAEVEITMLPSSTMPITDPQTAKAILGLMDALEDMDDVENVYSNFDIPDDLLETLQD